jgi:ribosome biogenesis GTPase / thiamine phosphate phosphatase
LQGETADEQVGTVRQIHRGRAWVKVNGELVEAHVRGGLKQGPRGTVHMLAVGDRVRLRRSEGRGVLVDEVLPRRNELARVDPSDSLQGRSHVLAANLDRICVVASLDKPRYNSRGVDRFLVLAHAAGIPAFLVLNKCDLRGGVAAAFPDPQKILGLYGSLGYETIGTSLVTGSGLTEFRDALSGRQTFLLGPSGAGKSSLINRLYGLDLRTAAVSSATSKGVHTTTRVDWVDLPEGGAVLDAPGLRSIQPWSLHRADVAACFREFHLAGPCRFGNCLHRGEPGCAVQNAVADGLVSMERLDSYRRLLDSLPG